MQDLLLPVERLRPRDRASCGGKAVNLGLMAQRGLTVPRGLCLTTAAYHAYLDATGMRGRILLELGRKEFAAMRWEEMWDASLRIRNMFAITPLPAPLARALAPSLASAFGEDGVVVRSSSVAEDSPATSFAGIHESFVNVRGTGSILEHIRLVWASLWSDAAFLYRRELGLDIRKSAMAVIVQEIVIGECSGIIFGINPDSPEEAVIESVWGLNQALVDGVVEPDRWILDRKSGVMRSHHAADRTVALVPGAGGVVMRPLTAEEAATPPLTAGDLGRLHAMVITAEEIFGSPQDMEWTKTGPAICVLQSRPVTGKTGDPGDERPWYLTLSRSFEDLQSLRQAIETRWLPEMLRAGEELAARDPRPMTDRDLADEILGRVASVRHWQGIYRDYFIPFAHGVRLFGTVYSDTIHPADPYEFTDLLSESGLISIDRNRELETIAAEVRRDPAVIRELADDDPSGPLNRRLSAFITRYKSSVGGDEASRRGIIALIQELASRPPQNAQKGAAHVSGLKERFLSHFTGEERSRAEELLDLARRSYALRDNDNHALDAIEAELGRAAGEGRRRLVSSGRAEDGRYPPEEIAHALRDPAYTPVQAAAIETPREERGVSDRQIVGQPASTGFACGPARVIREKTDLFTVRSGEVLVCDAIEPGMTFVVPLCAAIIERRGGMLIHGAIIAREYGIPCVTGIPDATGRIAPGDQVCVDGHLGIITIRREEKRA